MGIALAFMLLGFIKRTSDMNKFLLAIEWSKVEAHMAKVKTSLRIALDPDALRWAPTPPSGIIFESPLKSSPSGGDSGEDIEEDMPKDKKKKEEEEDLMKGERRKLPRRQILSTESESECALSGECAGLDGGASNNINRRKNRLNRSLVTPSGDSADGELSEDEASGQSGDRTATSSTKKLHKKSQKKSHFSSFSRNRKVKDRSEKVTKKSLRIRDTSDENSEADSDEELLLNRNLSPKKQNSSSKILDTSSSESDEGEKDLNLRKRDEKPRKEDNIMADEKLRKEDKL